ncbi:hypothetical protein, partial [Vibrio splendidus]|uniref:hypothetical protein n=1 Tax=Vibrio splendidus TaxID=29497 RepID=UPI001A7E1425
MSHVQKLVSATYQGLLQKWKMCLRRPPEHFISCVYSKDIEEFIEEDGSLLHPQFWLIAT